MISNARTAGELGAGVRRCFPMAASRRQDAGTDPEAILDEQKRLRRLRFVVDLTVSVLYQEPALTLEEGFELIQRAERAVLALFPGSEETFDLLIRPRLARALQERFPSDPSVN